MPHHQQKKLSGDLGICLACAAVHPQQIQDRFSTDRAIETDRSDGTPLLHVVHGLAAGTVTAQTTGGKGERCEVGLKQNNGKTGLIFAFHRLHDRAKAIQECPDLHFEDKNLPDEPRPTG